MNLYIDFDNTIVNSSEVIVKMLNEKFGGNKDWKKLRRYDFKDLFPSCSYWEIERCFESDKMFEEVELLPEVYETLNSFKDKFDKMSVVTIGTDINLEKKRRFVKDRFPFDIELIGIKNDGRSNKGSVDMRDGVFIDDHIDCLHSSNAKVKMLIKTSENSEWSKIEPNDDIYVVSNWYEIYSILDFITKNKEIYLWDTL